jgi:signal transduction histidine kinase
LANANHAIQGEGTITVTTARKEDELEATVGDTGVGIPQADLEKIFDPFYTTKETGRTDDPKVIKGTGLGLFLVRETIRRYRGRITVESAVGRGTSFHVFFPIAAGELKND